jgi:protocatechuate 4,5-dioxygenase beta chain
VAKLVEIIGIGHNPLMHLRLTNSGDQSPEVVKLRERFGELQQRLTDARPDVLLCIGNDHLNTLFMDNMPAFLVGKSPHAEGPWDWELDLGLPSYEAPVDVSLAKGIVSGGFNHSVDFAFSDEFKIDHAHTIPLKHLRPQMDLPIVPIFCNVMAPPIPTARRFYQVGEALRDIIEELPADSRVAAVCSGHLSVEIGGARSTMGACDPEFDYWSVDMVGRGDVEAVCRELTFERFWQSGNYTAGFLTFVMLLGLARGIPASLYDIMPMGPANNPFFVWDL